MTEQPSPTPEQVSEQVPELTLAKQVVLPFKILISPVKTFGQVAQKPTAKGLITLAALILLVTAAAQYASASKIILTVNNQPIDFLVTESFGGWYVGVFASAALSTFVYWAILAIGLTLVSQTFGGGAKTSWRALFVGFGYVLSVFIVLYAVRTIIYLALPPITFELSAWPPSTQEQLDQTVARMQQVWGSSYAYQIGTAFTFVALIWMVLLAAIAVRALRGVGWGRATAIAAISYTFTLLLFGIP